MKTITTSRQNVIRTVAAAAALCAALSMGARAGEAPQVHVSYADLNLHTAAGATTLNQRIREAANQVCALPVERDLGHVSQTKACTARVIAETAATLEKAGVTPAIQVAAR